MADHGNSHLCALVCVWSSGMLSSASSGVGGIWPVPELLWLILTAPAQTTAGAVARSLCLCSPVVGGCKYEWSC